MILTKSITRKLSSVLLAVLLLASSSVFPVQGASSAKITAGNKISSGLQSRLDEIDKDDLLPVYVWFEDIDFQKIEDDVYKSIGVNKASLNDDSLEKAAFFIDEMFQASDEPEMKLKKKYWEYLENTKAERMKEEEDIKKQIAAELGLEEPLVLDNSDIEQEEQHSEEQPLMFDNPDWKQEQEEPLVLDDLDYKMNEEQQELPLKEPSVLSNLGKIQKKDFSKYLENTKIERDKKSRSIQRYFDKEREFSRNAYNKQNRSFSEKYLGKGKILFSSQYAPMIICEISKQDILYLNKLECVTSISLYENIEIIEEGNLDVSLESIGAIYTRNTKGLRGKDVIIGQIEPDVPFYGIPDFNYNNIHIREDIALAPNFHPSIVAAIMVGSNGLAPDATLFCTTSGNNDEADEEAKNQIFYNNIEWLLDNNVNVINMSAGNKKSGSYDSLSQWVDHIIKKYDVSFVKSAGNEGPYGFVTSPGMAYNAITVGAINDCGTIDNDDDKFYADSSYITGDKAPDKPDVVAPGVGFSVSGDFKDILMEGTSFSAAHVTGMIAQLMQAFPGLKLYPEAVKALVMASCDRKTTDVKEPMDTLTNKEGAGVINVKRAAELSSTFFEKSMNSSKNYEKVKSIQVSSGNSATAVLTWFKQTTEEDLKSGDVTSPLLSKFNLIIEDNSTGELWYPKDDPGNNLHENNVKYILFKAPRTGTYNIYAERLTNTSTTERYALSCVGEFSVVEDKNFPAILNVKVNEVNNKVTVGFIGPTQGSAVLIVAPYIGKALTRMSTATITQDGSIEMDADLVGADRIKIMMWNSLTGMQPLCGSKEVIKIDGQWVQ